MKKVRLDTLKQGTKFVHGNSLYIIDDLGFSINLTCGTTGYELSPDIMVTPIKVLVSDIIRGATYG